MMLWRACDEAYTATLMVYVKAIQSIEGYC